MILNTGDLFEFRIIGRQSDQNIINVRHYKVANGPSTDQPITVFFNPIIDAFATVMKEVMVDSAEIRGYGVKRISPSVTSEVLSEHGNTFGEIAAEPLPLQVAKVFSLRAETAPSGTRGRFYMGGLSASIYDFNDHQFEAAGDTLFDAVATTLMDTVTAGGVDLVPVIFRREITVGYNITSVVHRRFAGTQRRRSRINGTDDHIFT